MVSVNSKTSNVRVFGLVLLWLVVVVGYGSAVGFQASDSAGDKLMALRVSDSEIEKAVSRGEYEKAREMYQSRQVLGFGENSYIESLVYPEREVERKIKAYQDLDLLYPGSRDIYLQLALLYAEKGSDLTAGKYLEMARRLDPNGSVVKEVESMLENQALKRE